MQSPPFEKGPPAAISLGLWLAAACVHLVAFGLMWAYHDLGRHKPYSVPTANEALALASVLGLALSLTFEPAHRLTGRWRGALPLGRPLLGVAFLFAILHLCFAGLLLREKYDRAYWAEHRALLILGALSAALFATLTVATFSKAARWLGVWSRRAVEAGSYLLLVLVLSHFMVLGKIPRWLDWARTRDQPLPPGTLPVFVLGLVPLALWGVGLFRRSRAATTQG